MEMLRRHPFVRDGMIWVALGIAWPALMRILCRPGGLACDVLDYLYGKIVWLPTWGMQPINGLIAEALNRNPSAVYSPDSRLGVTVLVSVEILEFLVYWFIVGGVVGFLWRLVRKQIDLFRAKQATAS